MASKEEMSRNPTVLREIRAELIRQRDCLKKTSDRDCDVATRATEAFRDSYQRYLDAEERVQVLEYYMRVEGIPLVGVVDSPDEG